VRTVLGSASGCQVRPVGYARLVQVHKIQVFVTTVNEREGWSSCALASFGPRSATVTSVKTVLSTDIITRMGLAVPRPRPFEAYVI
jgi:hypothetical protein